MQKANFNIDFNNVKNISEKLNEKEIINLNKVFNNEEIKNIIFDAEKKRRKISYIIYFLFFIFLILGLSLFIKDGAFTSIIVFLGFIFFVIGFILYTKLRGNLKKLLKSKISPIICKALNKKLLYSHDLKYSFNDILFLVGARFLRSFSTVESAEDSISFEYNADGKHFFINGFELKTSEIRGSGKNRRKVILNHCYLMKIHFPQAKLPMKDHLFIEKHTMSKVGEKIFLYVVPFIFFLIYILIMRTDGGCNTDSVIVCFLIKQIPLAFLIAWIFIIWQASKYRGSKVNLENIDFSKIYDVHCNDQVTSRMIITPAFMDRILKFMKETGAQYEFFFTENTLYLKRDINREFLEVSIMKDLTKNLDTYLGFYTNLREIIRFIYQMNLFYLSKTKVDVSSDNYKKYEVEPFKS